MTNTKSYLAAIRHSLSLVDSLFKYNKDLYKYHSGIVEDLPAIAKTYADNVHRLGPDVWSEYII